MVATHLTLALPDQDQAKRGQRRAVAGPLDLVDHEARLRPGDRAGALADPQQPDGERKEADDQKPYAHRLSLAALAARRSCNNSQCGALVHLGQEQGRRLLASSVPNSRKATKSPGQCRGFSAARVPPRSVLRDDRASPVETVDQRGAD